MNGQATDRDLDQAEEEILTRTASDDALEAAAGPLKGTYSYGFVTYDTACAGCC
jgi:hypothetical protein